MHVGLYTFLNAPLVGRYPLTPAVIYHSPVEHWRSGYLSPSGPLTENVGSGGLDSNGDEIYFFFDCPNYQNARIKIFHEIKAVFVDSLY